MIFKTLYLCEKPSQGRDIARVLNCNQKQDGYLHSNDTAVTWCFGHLIESAAPDSYCPQIKPWRMEILPIIPTKWEMIAKKDSKKQLTVIKSLLKEIDTVVVATDADREGEVIARELLELYRFKGDIKRLWLSALDDESIKSALSKLREGKTTENLYYAGLARQRADWLIGMNITMATSVLFSRYGEGVLSVGRVQSPTLKLVVDRDHAINHFKSVEYFELSATFITDKDESFVTKWQPADEITNPEGRILSKEVISSITDKITGKNGCVTKFETKEKNQSSPLGLSLSQLQKLASSRFNLSAKETLDIAQALYETHKAITYPRTDCQYLPENQHVSSDAILKQLKIICPHLESLLNMCDPHLKSPIWNDKKITAHHAMIPTLNQYVSLEKMSDSEKKIYELISLYYIAQFLGSYVFAERIVEITCSDELFKASSQTPIKYGWKAALRKIIEDDLSNHDEDASTIPFLTIDQSLLQKEIKILTKNTKPPLRFTEGTLIDAMKNISKYVLDKDHQKTLRETSGIGTEATRAAIIETLFKRNYIEKKGKQLFSTEKGQKLISLLPSTACDPILTAEWEEQLNRIADGELSLDSFIASQEGLLCRILKELNPSSEVTPSIQKPSQNATAFFCPKCQKNLIKRQSFKEKRYFWGCTNYPTCRFTANDLNDSPSFQFVKGATNAAISK